MADEPSRSVVDRVVAVFQGTVEGLWDRTRRLVSDLRANEGGPKMEWRSVVVLLVTPVLLTIYHYFGKPSYYRGSLEEKVVAWLGADWTYHGLEPYVYWAGASIVIRVLIPLAVVVLVLRMRPRDIGFRVRGTLRHVPIYLVLFLAVMPFVYLASLRGNFQARYPFYLGASQGGWHFWGYELCYFVQFFSLEAFFRGFIIFPLFKRFGYYAVLIMVIPYCMIHFNKPLPETLGAIVAGMILGVLALRSGSFYLGVVIHFAVALAMDVLALQQKGILF
jgi:membrane protease YdiL (CAAX protease family)